MAWTGRKRSKRKDGMKERKGEGRPFLNPGDGRAALLGVWLAASLVMLLVLAAPFVAPAEMWGPGVIPVCERKAATGEDCPACGLTRGFLAISRGEFRESRQYHTAALPLYGLFLVNQCAVLPWAARRVMRRWRERRRRRE
jgi:hypothetical protein